jgi:hypothetical protein
MHAATAEPAPPYRGSGLVEFATAMDKTEQLRLLAIFHYGLAAIAAVFSMFPLIHVGFGLAMLRGVLDHGRNQPPPFVGWMLVAIGSLFIVAGLSYAILVFLAGRFLSQRRHYLFCLAVAGIETIFMPFGTVLGVFTIVALVPEPAKALFATRS